MVLLSKLLMSSEADHTDDITASQLFIGWHHTRPNLLFSQRLDLSAVTPEGPISFNGRARHPHTAALLLVGLRVEVRGNNGRKGSWLVDFSHQRSTFCQTSGLRDTERFCLLFLLSVEFSSVVFGSIGSVFVQLIRHIYCNYRNLQSCCFSAMTSTRSEAGLDTQKNTQSEVILLPPIFDPCRLPKMKTCFWIIERFILVMGNKPEKMFKWQKIGQNVSRLRCVFWVHWRVSPQHVT